MFLPRIGTEMLMKYFPHPFYFYQNTCPSPFSLCRLAFNYALPMKHIGTNSSFFITDEPLDMFNLITFILNDIPRSLKCLPNLISSIEGTIVKPIDGIIGNQRCNFLKIMRIRPPFVFLHKFYWRHVFPSHSSHNLNIHPLKYHSLV